jgi:hypothetical protein
MPLADHIEAETGWRSAGRCPSLCGRHYQDFDPAPARALFRQRMNRVLASYRGGFQVSDSGVGRPAVKAEMLRGDKAGTATSISSTTAQSDGPAPFTFCWAMRTRIAE